MQKRLVIPPANEPVTVEEVKLHTKIEYDIEDKLLETWITSIREIIESSWGKACITQTWELIFDAFPRLPIEFPRNPVQAVEAITYFDEDNNEHEIALPNFFVDTDSECGRLGFAAGRSWSNAELRPMNAVKIQFTAGLGDDGTTTPSAVKDAIMLYCAWRDQNRAMEKAADHIPLQVFSLVRSVWGVRV